MTQTKTVASLFEEKPRQWNLRGDPHLWREMAAHFAQTPLPATADELSALIETAFESLTGYPLSSTTPFFIERYSHGGMSSGYISPDFWRDKILPLLRIRYAELLENE